MSPFGKFVDRGVQCSDMLNELTSDDADWDP